MENLNELIPKSLNKWDTTFPSKELPQLTLDEREEIVLRERKRRAAILNMPIEKIRISQDIIDKMFEKARNEKHSLALAKKYWKEVYTEKPVPHYTTEEVLMRFHERASQLSGRKFIIDNHNKEIIQKLCLYFSGSDEMQDYGLDPKKGIMLVGGVGCGKTTIMKAFMVNQHQSYMLVPARKVSYQFAERGFPVIDDYVKVERMPANMFKQTELGICFDDLGTEEERKHYGDKINAMTEIILSRYDNVSFKMTHITTNMNAQVIGETYGDRVRSRMREMFNLLYFDIQAPDRRQ